MTFLSLWTWLKPLRRQAKVARRRHRRPERTLQTRFVPRLEALEERTLLSNYTVNALTDTGAGSGLAGDLRYCITNATSGNDTIVFGVTGTIKLDNVLPAMNTSVAIQGPGASQLTVEPDPAVFPVFPDRSMFAMGRAATVQISGITIANGKANPNGIVGAITNAGTLNVSDSTFANNDGAIDNSGSATVSNSTFFAPQYMAYNNRVVANSGTLIVSDSTISRIFADNGLDGAIVNTGNLTVSNSTLSDNYGNAIDNSGSATVNNSTLSGNSTGYGIEGAIVNTGSLTVSNSTLSGNSGAGIHNSGSATVNNSTLSSNFVFAGGDASGDGLGGGVYNTGNLTVNNSTLSGNTVLGVDALNSGSSASGSPPGNGSGGGIYTGGGTLSINNSTLAGNQAIGGSSGFSIYGSGNGLGGGLYIAGGTVTIDHSTLAGNQALGGWSAGIGYVPQLGYGGGIYNAAGPSALQMHDTILASNKAYTGPDLDGSVSSLGYNLIGNTAGGSGFVASDLLNLDPKLGPLQNNGGPTQTMALLAGSPAIDAGDPSDNTNPNTPAYDQRGSGFARIVNGIIDIGAFEVQSGNFTQPSNRIVAGFPATTTTRGVGNFAILASNADGPTAAGIDASRAAAWTASSERPALPATPPTQTPGDGEHWDRLVAASLEGGTSFLVSKSKGDRVRLGEPDGADAVW